MSDFKTFKHEWFDPYGPFAPLYLINQPRLNFLVDLCKAPPQSLMDVGCGAGILTQRLPEYFPKANIFGLDESDHAIQLATMHAEIFNLDIKYQTRSALKPFDQKYDLISCLELIEHLDDPSQLIENCANHLNSQGYLVISTLDRSFRSLLQNIIIAEDLLNIVPPGTHDYRQFLKPSEICEMAREYGLKPIDMTGIVINPLTYEANLSNDSLANYIIGFQKTK